MHHRIDLAPARRLDARSQEPGSERNVWIGQNRYYVTYRGERIGEFRCPNTAASRYLLAEGLANEADTISTFRDGVEAMSGSVGVMAKLTVTENEKGGPVWAKYRAMPQAALPSRGELLGAIPSTLGHTPIA